MCGEGVQGRHLSMNRTVNISEQWVIQASLSMLLNERRKKNLLFLYEML